MSSSSPSADEVGEDFVTDLYRIEGEVCGSEGVGPFVGLVCIDQPGHPREWGHRYAEPITTREEYRVNARYIVRGHFCPTDANPETDASPTESVVACETLEEAERLLPWYPGGYIVDLVFPVEVRETPEVQS